MNQNQEAYETNMYYMQSITGNIENFSKHSYNSNKSSMMAKNIQRNASVNSNNGAKNPKVQKRNNKWKSGFHTKTLGSP